VAAAAIGGAAAFEHLDVRDEASWIRVVANVERRHGRLDVLVNNAGIATPYDDLLNTSVTDFQRTIDVNLLGVFLGMKVCAPLLGRDGGGTIINIASTGGERVSPRRISYSATKFAVRGMTRVAALELAPLGVRVNCVLPGAVATEMIVPGGAADAEPSDRLRRYLERVPLRRLGNADELAKLVLFLACDDSSYCTGGEFVADGGYLLN
jgi:3alpha(or 20beta)-hydroxysteroid dehydrogenase